MRTLTLVILAALGLAACDDFLDINDDPNAALEPPIDGLLASTTLATAENTQAVSASFAAFFSQYLASPNEGTATDTYLEADYSGTWRDLYGAMTDAFDLRELAAERGATHHVGVAKVVTAMNLALVVDNWGAAPYDEAFDGEIIVPAYDSPEELYEVIFTLLDEAADDLLAEEPTAELDADSDFIHAGDLAAWRRTIEALRARQLLHLSETERYDPAAVLAAVDSAYASNDDDAQVTRFLVRNPWASVALNNQNLLLGGWLSEQFVDALNGVTYGTFDPRLPRLTDTTVFGDYRGTVNGAGRVGDGTQPEESYLELGGALSSEDSPLIILSYAELKFVEAEAALDAGLGERAGEAFFEGVRASMAKLGVDPADAEAYLAEAYPEIVDGSAAVELDDVFREKYAALFLSPETWVDARRYDYAYEGFELPENAALDAFIRRVAYPASEISRNAGNVPAVEGLAEPLFWDR